MIMTHLLLAGSKNENDASITKILSRRPDLWIRCKLGDLFVEAKALQELLRKLFRKREVDEFKAFDKRIVSGKISNVLQCLSDVAKGGVLSTSDKVTLKGKTSLYSIFYNSRKADLEILNT